MIKAVGVLLLSVFVFLLDYRSVKRSESKRDKVVHIVFFIIATVYFLIFALGVKLPYTMEWIKQAYEPIVEPFNEQLKSNRIDKQD